MSSCKKISDLDLVDETIYQQNICKAELSLHEFIRQAWPIIGDKEFIDGRHIQATCKHLELVAERKIKKLLINLPPRFSKSTIISVAFPAWVLANNPSERFLCSSYALQLANRDSRYCRTLIQSPWYQKNWGNRFSLLKDQNTKGRFDNTKKGYRIATSSKSAATGEGGGILIADDPNNVKDIQSKVDREGRLDWWSQIWSTRLNDAKNDCLIVVQQRTHEQDISGYIIANDINNEWTKLILPMEFELSRKSQTFVNNKLWWEDWRQTEGELLWPERIGEKEIESAKLTLGSYGYAGQYQQRPSPAEGGIIKKHWFKRWTMPDYPTFEYIIQSWDCGISDSPTASYSACTTWGVFYNEHDVYNVILLSMWRGRVGFPELRQRAIRMSSNYLDTGVNSPQRRPKDKVDFCLIEAKATGDPLIRELRLANIPAKPYEPKGDKHSRVQRVSALIEGGVVWVPTEIKNPDKLLPWADEFVESVASFPNLESRDLVDTMTQLLSHLRESNDLKHPQDYEDIRFTKPPISVY